MITWLKDFFGIQDLRRDQDHIRHNPCIVRHGLSAEEEYAETEDLNRIAKWQPGELKRMSDKIIAGVVEPVLLAEQEKHRAEKAVEFSRGYAEGQAIERERWAGVADSRGFHNLAGKIRNGDRP